MTELEWLERALRDRYPSSEKQAAIYDAVRRQATDLFAVYKQTKRICERVFAHMTQHSRMVG